MKEITRLFATLFIAALIFIFRPSVNADASTVATGKAGDTVTWELDDQGIMTFSGTGDMYSYGTFDDPEWQSYKSQIKALVFEDGVTCIGNSAFEDCDNLSSVEVSDNITSIKEYAFFSCNNLKSVDTGDGVTTIDSHAFYACTTLESIYIGKSVSSIGLGVCDDCNALNKVEIGSLESWLKISFPDASYNPLSTAGHLYLDGIEVTDLVIPDDITEIQRNAFTGCVGLKTVDTGINVTRIVDRAFADCTNLQSVKVGSNVTSIGLYSFMDCNNLKEITLGRALQTIGIDAFSGINSEAVFRLPDYSDFNPQYFTDNGFTYVFYHVLKKMEAVEPTCISSGLKEYYYCMGCGKIFADAEGKEETTLNDLTIVGGHVLTPIAGKAATCAKAGNNAYYICSICGQAFKDANSAVKTTVAAETIAKTTNHKYVKKTVAAKIGVAGKTYQKCSVCGKVINVKTIAALKPAATAIKTIKAGKKSFTVTWTKKSYTGYQIRYSLKSSMASSKTVP